MLSSHANFVKIFGIHKDFIEDLYDIPILPYSSESIMALY